VAEVVRETAHAKINPYLRVLGKRGDGYHEIETLILPISLADHVAVSPRDEGFGLRVTGPRADRVPGGDDNLAVRAARALASAAGVSRGADILIDKHVPVAAGLGGGSSDAAAVLRALNRLWSLDLDTSRLAEIGAEVGSDVPALVHARPVIARGRGERIEPVDVPQTFWLLITPDIEVSAVDAYAWSRGLRRALRRAPPLERLVETLKSGEIEDVGSLLHNDLAFGVRKRHPAVANAEGNLLAGSSGGDVYLFAPGSRVGAIGAVMSGSGPAVAGLWDDRDAARNAADLLGALYVDTIAGHEP
jgi:4-diphosphocytidyl-2-C-methyl-D-erythritol kinase